MKWTIKLVFEAVTGSPVEHELGIIERAEEISPATVGLTIAEGKALLASLQEQVVTAQVQQHSSIARNVAMCFARRVITSPLCVLYTAPLACESGA
jgi:hypothetical protein